MGRKIRFQAKCHHGQLYKFSISSELLELSLWWRFFFFFLKETHSGLSLIDKRNVDDKWLSVDKLVAMVQIWTSPKVPSLAEKSLAVSNAAHSSFCGVKVKPVSEQLAEL